MRTITTVKTVYTFAELGEKAKEKAIDANYYVNVEDDWHEATYEDAENVGLIIKEYDIERGSYVKAFFENNAQDTATRITQDHGKECSTYKTAIAFLQKVKDAATIADEQQRDNKVEELEEQFLKDIQEDYLQMLRDDYQYQTSKEAIIETIEANEWEFTDDGKRI